MRIQHNLAAYNAHRTLGGNNTAVGKNLEKLSSGYKINRAGDDAAGLAISEKMRSQIKGLETASKNAQDGISLIQTAEGALTEVHSMMNRMVEIATQSANGTYTDTDRTKLQAEYTELDNEILRIGTSTDFNGTKMLTGAAANLQIGTEATDRLTVTVVAVTKVGGSIATSAGAVAAIKTINAAIETTSVARGVLGAAQNRLEHTVNNLGVTAENVTAAESRIRDVDMAQEMMSFTKNNILTQASQAMLAQANQIPQGVLQLLQ